MPPKSKIGVALSFESAYRLRLLCESPYHNWIIGLVLKRAKPSVPSPSLEVGLQTGTISPRIRFDIFFGKSAILKQKLQTLLGPAVAINWDFVDPQQKRGRDDKPPTRSEHLENVASSSMRPRKMLENLIRND